MGFSFPMYQLRDSRETTKEEATGLSAGFAVRTRKADGDRVQTQHSGALLTPTPYGHRCSHSRHAPTLELQLSPLLLGAPTQLGTRWPAVINAGVLLLCDRSC